jgi:hypothetical protein
VYEEDVLMDGPGYDTVGMGLNYVTNGVGVEAVGKKAENGVWFRVTLHMGFSSSVCGEAE